MPATPHVVQPLSDGARRLLSELRLRGATKPERAMKDADIAKYILAPEREIVTLAGELIDAGHVIIARVSPPYGRWLLQPPRPGEPAPDLKPAYEYADSLNDRGVAVLSRGRKLRAAIEAIERGAHPDSRGQLSLGLNLARRGAY